MRRITCFTIFIMLIAYGTSYAAIIGIDFGTGTQATPANWTSVSAEGTYNSLIDETGAATSVSLNVNDPGLAAFYNANADISTIPSHSISLSAINENIYRSNSDAEINFTFSGLKANNYYRVWVIGLRDGFLGLNQNVTITGQGFPVSFSQIAASRYIFVNDTLGDQGNDFSTYAKTITATSGGEISINVSSGGELYSIAGIAIEEMEGTYIPAPTLSEWGIIILTILLASSMILMRNRIEKT